MYKIIDRLVRVLKKILPRKLIRPLLPAYHYTLGFVMALAYGFPARKLTVFGITGTKGKSTTSEMLFSILREAGYKTALISTIRFAIEDESEPNRFKMTLQGRGFAQQFMRKALRKGATHVVVEITSESVLQFRNRFFFLDGLIVTNIHHEHIEHHGSFENYVAAKRKIVRTLERSPKKKRVLVCNEDIVETKNFLSAKVPTVIPFSAKELEKLTTTDDSVQFTYAKTPFSVPIAGAFNAQNALAAVKLMNAFGIPLATSAAALKKLPVVRGRVEHVSVGQDFLVIVDYAHTPDSLSALYSAFPKQRKICILGNTGGGRDTWKRPEMGRIADESCNEVILTNEDPYDEDPQKIVDDMIVGMKRKPTVIMDRREAMHYAFSNARKGDAVLISGKGTDPYIMGPHDSKLPWSDAQVAREELEKMKATLVS